ncbi:MULTISPECIES: hypothetical protein [Proteus]|nr:MULTISPECIES: hypothetical protein [Proteus]
MNMLEIKRALRDIDILLTKAEALGKKADDFIQSHLEMKKAA